VRRKGFVVGLVAAVAVLVLSSSAHASVSFDTLEAKGSLGHGFKIGVDANASKGRDQAALTIEKREGTTRRSADYVSLAPGRVTSARRVVSKFGKRGSIAMTFRPEGKPEVGHFRCGRYTEARGELVGHLRFRGEHHYIEVHEERLQAHMLRIRHLSNCDRRGAERPGPGTTMLSCRRDGGGLFLDVIPPFGAFFSASSPPRLGRRLIEFEELDMPAAPSDYSIPRDLDTATITPPAPFTGSASYQATRHASERSSAGRLKGDIGMTTLSGASVDLTPSKAKFKRGNEISLGCSFGFGDSSISGVGSRALSAPGSPYWTQLP